jgi:hypothetical protein
MGRRFISNITNAFVSSPHGLVWRLIVTRVKPRFLKCGDWLEKLDDSEIARSLACSLILSFKLKSFTFRLSTWTQWLIPAM